MQWKNQQHYFLVSHSLQCIPVGIIIEGSIVTVLVQIAHLNLSNLSKDLIHCCVLLDNYIGIDVFEHTRLEQEMENQL
jgi:hypothetical protein